MPNSLIEEYVEKILKRANEEYLPREWYFPSEALNLLRTSLQEYGDRRVEEYKKINER